MNPSYLGDSVYVETDNGMLKLYLDNGNGPHTIIYLEEEVYEALTRYVDRLGRESRDATPSVSARSE